MAIADSSSTDLAERNNAAYVLVSQATSLSDLLYSFSLANESGGVELNPGTEIDVLSLLHEMLFDAKRLLGGDAIDAGHGTLQLGGVCQ